MSYPFISVVIPVGGSVSRLTNLDYVLLGLEQQTFKDFDVVVVNDGASNDYYDVIRKHSDKLHISYIWQPKYQPSTGAMPPRNTGALLARADYILTLDSDNVLEKNALAYYVEDIECVPDRVVCGQYHWLPPLEITEEDVIERWQNIITDWDWETRRYKGTYLEPLPNDGSHNIMPELRSQFRECTVTELHGVGDDPRLSINDGLGILGGNALFPKKIWFDAGGNADWLIAGLCDDGALGLEILWKGHAISFDNRILAGHLWHPRNRQWVQTQSALEVDKLDRVYRLGRYDDGSVPEHIQKQYYLSMKRNYEAWGYKYDRRFTELDDVPEVELPEEASPTFEERDMQGLEKILQGRSDDIRLIMSSDDPTVWAIVDGIRHGFTSEKVMFDLGWSWGDLSKVHPKERDEYPRGIPIEESTEKDFVDELEAFLRS